MSISGADPSSPGDPRRSHPEDYVILSSTQLTPVDEAEMGNCVQRGSTHLQQIIDTIAPHVTAALQRLDCHPFTPEQIEASVREGLQAALDDHCAKEEPGTDIAGTAIRHVRGAVATLVDGAGLIDGEATDGDGWASTRFTPAVLSACLQGLVLGQVWPVLHARQVALRRLVESQFHVVEPVARSFMGRGIDLDDLRQEGIMALRDAALGYDASRDRRFGAYARTAVRNRLVDLFRTEGGPSAHLTRQVVRFKQAKLRLAHMLGRSPANAEVFDGLDWSPTERKNVEPWLTGQRPHSLDVIQEKTGALPQDLLAEEPLAIAEHREHLAMLGPALEHLDETERQVVQLRQVGPEILTQKETAQRLQLPLDRVRKVEAAAMKKLCHLFRVDTAAPGGNRASGPRA